jgi:hypothetical protein
MMEIESGSGDRPNPFSLLPVKNGEGRPDRYAIFHDAEYIP